MTLFPVLADKSTSPIFSLEEIGEAAFEYFSSNGFPYYNLPKHVCMHQINELRKKSGSALLRSNVASHVADTYHPHRFHANSFGVRSPVESFLKEKILRRAIRLHLHYGYVLDTKYFGTLNVVGGTHACSNFRPAFTLYVYRRYCNHGGTVLDTCFGFGGRLVGYLASDCTKYIGFDPSTKSYEGNQRMVADLAKGKEVVLRCSPIEDADPSEFEESAELAFTSPPYFCREIYSDEETQSCHRYRTARDWCNGFLVPMMRFQYRSVKHGCYALVNIADVKIRDKIFPLVKWAIKAGQKVGFDYKEQFLYALSRRFGPKRKGVSMEPVLVFQKV